MPYTIPHEIPNGDRASTLGGTRASTLGGTRASTLGGTRASVAAAPGPCDAPVEQAAHVVITVSTVILIICSPIVYQEIVQSKTICKPNQPSIPSADMAEDELGFLLQRAHRRLRAAHNHALAPSALSIAHVAVLGLVSAHGALTQRQLIDVLEVDKSAMVYLIDELERQKLVERRPAPGDRRANAVHLTAHGSKRLAATGAIAARVQAEFLAPLTARERSTLRALLGKLVAGPPRPDDSSAGSDRG
jgi:DNA-binding MarR family transcriptional regulator